MYEHRYVCHEQNERQNHNINTDNKHLKNMAMLKYFGTIPTNQNRINAEIKIRMNPGNACYHLSRIFCLSVHHPKTSTLYIGT
jgi:hypothetical protein